MDVVHSLTLSIHTLYCQVQVLIPQRGNWPPDPGGGVLLSGVDTGSLPQHLTGASTAQSDPSPDPETHLDPCPQRPPSSSGEVVMNKRGAYLVQMSSPTRATPGQSSPNHPMNSDLKPKSPSPLNELENEFPQRAIPYQDTDIEHMHPEPKHNEYRAVPGPGTTCQLLQCRYKTRSGQVGTRASATDASKEGKHSTPKTGHPIEPSTSTPEVPQHGTPWQAPTPK
ncbi:hypothetical protein CHARACLAT_030765 [Characodon lateralis]|uniref:Prolactin receptor n=1 Tax=Characodon lateralis TaxID=208331 RepID=A0ABU7EP93_9TELE|nr:hypothetical protein [Characodon lateralis]